MHVEKTGNWNKANRVVRSLQHEMRRAQLIALRRWGLLAENIAVTHISKQDLGWKALKPGTISSKVRLGYSEDILVRSSTYFQAITSFISDDTAYAGVRRNVTYANGTEIANIAAIHEFGSKTAGIPKRPLWKPTYKETITRIATEKKFNPSMIFIENLNKLV